MKRNSWKIILLMMLLIVVSCDEPETVVTNYVHTDGSVTRSIEMKNTKNSFEISNLKVPFDSTWNIRDSIEIGEKGDTTWVKRAKKLFMNTDEINLSYSSDSGANKDISRHTFFKKSFKWFNTGYRFSEIIDKELENGYPLKDFMNREELLYFYSPETLKEAKKSGPDSLKYKSLSDSVDQRNLNWVAKNLVSEWIGQFSKFTLGKEGSRAIVDSLKSREDELSNLIAKHENEFDSLWSKGIILKRYLGEDNYEKFKSEADSATEETSKVIFIDFKDYSVRIVMPGKVIDTNGFIDSSQVLLWPVKSDYFISEQYEMWAESKVPNIWAWIISGLFIVFVLTGLLIKIKKKG